MMMKSLFLLIAVAAVLPEIAHAQSCTDGTNRGTCMDVNQCTGTTKRGLCPGAANIRCCFQTAQANPPANPQPQEAPAAPAANGRGWPLHYEASKSCTGSARRGTRALSAVFRRHFSQLTDGGIYNCRNSRGGSSLSEHAEGRAADLMCRVTAENTALAEFIAENAVALGVQAVIFNRRVWGYGRWNWRAYSGVNPHTDHIHVGMHRAGADGLTEADVEAVIARRNGRGAAAAPPPPPPAPAQQQDRAAPAAGRTCMDDSSNEGVCISKSQCTNGTPKRGFCPGSADIQCCIPNQAAAPAPPAPQQPAVVQQQEEPQQQQQQPVAAAPQPPPQPQAQQARGPACTDRQGNAGFCVDVSTCTGTSVSGRCAGPSNIRCCLNDDAGAGAPPAPPVTQGDAAYDPTVAAPTGGGGFSRSFSGLERSARNAGGPVYFMAKAAIDADGSGPHHGDPHAQSQTALSIGGRFLNADLQSYFVLPPAASSQFGIKLGDVALIRYKGRHTAAIFGDVGPSSKIGEISIKAAKDLGIPWSPISGGVPNGVEYFVYPGSRPSPLTWDVATNGLGAALAAAQARVGGGGAVNRADTAGAEARAATGGDNGTGLSDWALGLICGIAGTVVIAGILVAVVVARSRYRAAHNDAYTPLLDDKDRKDFSPRTSGRSPSPGVSRRSGATVPLASSTPGLARRAK